MAICLALHLDLHIEPIFGLVRTRSVSLGSAIFVYRHLWVAICLALHLDLNIEPIFGLVMRNDKGYLILFKYFLFMELKMSSVNGCYQESNTYLLDGL